MKITRYIKHYDFPVPERLTEVQFNQAKEGLPIQPYIQVYSELFSKYGGALLLRSVFFWVPSGTYTSAINYYKMLSKKKKFYTDLYEAINTSNTYKEYCEKYNALVKKNS